MDKHEIQGIVALTALFAGTVIVIIWLLKPKEQAPLATTVVQQPILYPAFPGRTMETEVVTETKPSQAYNKQVSVTEQITELYHQKDGLPWTRFGLYNAGPDPVYACVNTWLWPEAPIQVGQTVSYDFGEPGSIKKVYFKCDAGQQATVNLNVVE